MKRLISRFLSAIGTQVRTRSHGKTQFSGGKALAFAAGVFAASLLSPAFAQSLSMRATLPFPFQIGDKVLEAGNYVVEIDKQSRTIVFHNGVEYASVAVGLPSAYRDEHDVLNGRLQFVDYGKAHVLRKIWARGESKGYAIQESNSEREIARNAAKKPSVTEVASR